MATAYARMLCATGRVQRLTSLGPPLKRGCTAPMQTHVKRWWKIHLGLGVAAGVVYFLLPAGVLADAAYTFTAAACGTVPAVPVQGSLTCDGSVT